MYYWINLQKSAIAFSILEHTYMPQINKCFTKTLPLYHTFNNYTSTIHILFPKMLNFHNWRTSKKSNNVLLLSIIYYPVVGSRVIEGVATECWRNSMQFLATVIYLSAPKPRRGFVSDAVRVKKGAIPSLVIRFQRSLLSPRRVVQKLTCRG